MPPTAQQKRRAPMRRSAPFAMSHVTKRSLIRHVYIYFREESPMTAILGDP